MTRPLTLTCAGIAGTRPILNRVGANNRAYTRFRVAHSHRYRTDSGEWVNGETTWFTAKAWGPLAENIALSVHKGDPLLLEGRMGTESWEGADGATHQSTTLTLSSCGHDLSWGESRFIRSRQRREETEEGSSTGETGSSGADSSTHLSHGPAQDERWDVPLEAEANPEQEEQPYTPPYDVVSD